MLGQITIPMLLSAEALKNSPLHFSAPRRLRDTNIELVFAAFRNAKPVLIETPNFPPEFSSKSGKLIVAMRDRTVSDISKLLEVIDMSIGKNCNQYSNHLQYQGSLVDGLFTSNILLGSKNGRDTKFFMSNKKEPETDLTVKQIEALLDSAKVRLICRLDGYCINLSKKIARPIWYVEQCLITNNEKNPVGKQYHFLDDEIDLYHLEDDFI